VRKFVVDFIFGWGGNHVVEKKNRIKLIYSLKQFQYQQNVSFTNPAL
jgi:hypothetical protein